MAEIVDDILMLARTGHRVDPTNAIDLDAMATGCWANVDTQDASLDIESNVQVKADQVHIQNLLENLIRNAVEHGGGAVTVRLGKLSDADGFYVEDDGFGIPPEDRDRVFESGYSSVEGNVGLGLNIVREIAESHDWDVTLTDSQNGGTRFEFSNVTIID
jgi:signal transduction histidine kinase